tara:strand:- start:1596 stop:1790 length:195 start_codon:yes stop_codon:yes gene_type:complete
MYLKIDEKYINVEHIIMIAETPNNLKGKLALYVFGLKTPIYTDAFVSANSLIQKIKKIKKTGEI